MRLEVWKLESDNNFSDLILLFLLINSIPNTGVLIQARQTEIDCDLVDGKNAWISQKKRNQLNLLV